MMPLGVTGNTPDSGSGESWFDPRRGNSAALGQSVKMLAFTTIAPASRRAIAFLAIEHWLPCVLRVPATVGLSRETGRRSDNVFYASIRWAISQLWPAGSTKFAVRIPHGLSLGPASSVTPRFANSAQAASTSSTQMLS